MDDILAHILVVEDDEFLGPTIQAILEGADFTTSLAVNGQEAVKQLEGNAFDCIVSDLQMPIMTGIELLKWVHQNKPLPFVLMTGFIDEATQQMVLSTGAPVILNKPFPPGVLEDTVQKAIDNKLKSAV